MPLPTAAELTDPNATNTQMKQRLGQLAENVESKNDAEAKLGTKTSLLLTNRSRVENGATVSGNVLTIPAGSSGVNSYISKLIELYDSTKIAGKKLKVVAHFIKSAAMTSDLAFSITHIKNSSTQIDQHVPGSIVVENISATEIKVSADYIVQSSTSLQVSLLARVTTVSTAQSNTVTLTASSAYLIADAVTMSEIGDAYIKNDLANASQQANDYVDEKLNELPIESAEYDGIAVTISFKGSRQRTFLESGWDGKPTEHSANLIKSSIGIDSSKQYDGIEYAIVYKSTGQILYGTNEFGVPLNSFVPNADFVAYGDSTTYGDELSNPLTSRWSTLLATDIDKSIVNMGINGARAEEIQCRFGAINASMSVASATIPESGSVVLTAIDLNPVRLGNNLPVDLLTEDGIKVSGTLARASDTTATFTRSIAGSAITTNRVKVISTSQQDNRSKILFLGQGINNEPLLEAGTHTVDQIKSWYRSAINYLNANQEFIIWGILDRGAGEASGTFRGDFIDEMEKWFASEFGARFCAVRQFLSSDYAITIAKKLEPSFTETSADTAAIAVKRTPPSFRATSGSVHLNELGHKLQAWFFKQHLLARGII